MDIKADVIDYIGKYEDGVLVLLSIDCDGDFTEGMIYYSDKKLSLTVETSVEKKLGMPIEFWGGYRNLLESILKRVVPYNEIINRLDEIDFSNYFGKVEKEDDSSFGEEIDESDIQK